LIETDLEFWIESNFGCKAFSQCNRIRRMDLGPFPVRNGNLPSRNKVS
jgi:hypothetical protein